MFTQIRRPISLFVETNALENGRHKAASGEATEFDDEVTVYSSHSFAVALF
jgi:hypothetical protein